MRLDGDRECGAHKCLINKVAICTNGIICFASWTKIKSRDWNEFGLVINQISSLMQSFVRIRIEKQQSFRFSFCSFENEIAQFGFCFYAETHTDTHTHTNHDEDEIDDMTIVWRCTNNDKRRNCILFFCVIVFSILMNKTICVVFRLISQTNKKCTNTKKVHAIRRCLYKFIPSTEIVQVTTCVPKLEVVSIPTVVINSMNNWKWPICGISTK